MVLSVSRRTDIPRFYFDWFLNRLDAGYVLVRNPMNHAQVSRVRLDGTTIDCIVFWTKDPAPMLPKLDVLEPYPYFVQFTLNGYGRDVECALPDKKNLLDSFKRLAAQISPDRVVWRYSPILFGGCYTMDHHLQCFEKLARGLKGSTGLCRISFLDMYPKIAARMRTLGFADVPDRQKPAMVKRLVELGQAYGMQLGGCGNMDLAAAGLEPVGCIDNGIVSKLTGTDLRLAKDSGQRKDCYCAQSIDIGSYNTCSNGCVYCYANHSTSSIERKMAGYDPAAPMLCDMLLPTDVVKERVVTLYGNGQQRFC